MAQLANFGRQILSWFSPAKVEVSVRTRLLPSGQLELEPEYTLGGEVIPISALGVEARGSYRGIRFKVSPTASEVKTALPDGLTRVRASHARYWTNWLAERKVSVTGRSGSRAVMPQTLSVDLTLDLQADDSLRTQAALSTGSGIEVDPRRLRPIPDEPGWFQLDDQLFERRTVSPAVEEILALPTGAKTFLDGEVPALLEALDPPPPGVTLAKNELLAGQVVLKDPVDTIRIEATPDAIKIQQGLSYQDRAGGTHYEPIGDAKRLLAGASAGPRHRYRRLPDEGWVKVLPEDLQAAAAARASLPAGVRPGETVSGQDIPEALDLLLGLGKERRVGRVEVSERVKQHHRPIDVPAEVSFRLSVVESEGAESVLQIEPAYRHGDQVLPHPEVAETVREKRRWIRRPRSWVKIDRDKFNAVDDTAARNRLAAAPGGFVFHAAGRDEILAQFARLGRVEQDPSYLRFLQQLATFQGIEAVPLPASLAPGIRLYPYQQQGYYWLAFLRRFGLNGILADDMGLGKTLQTLTAIAHSIEVKATGSLYPSLIVCPVSLLANWEAEVNRFFPRLTALQYRGSDRIRLRREFGRVHVVLVSYTIAVNDADELSRCSWNYIILDEAHSIKNPETQRTKSIKRLAGSHKLSLTGTPVQNSPSDLWSQFDFLMPGYLGLHGSFKTEYASLIHKKGAEFNPAAAEVLRKRIDPFILRRLKKDVALDLPEKLIIDRIIELSADQVRAYQALLNTGESRAIRQSIERNEYRSQSIHILALLTRMRQICGHPALASKGADWKETESAKLDALLELCEELKEGGHRALVFSQFTSMLDIIGAELQQKRYPYLRIDGSTRPTERQPLVDLFNRDESYTCMLLSTKAGGTGLNLTGADTVIFYDHDWNPANDQQAQDRAYRIGQKRNVTVYRLITKRTVEEKMMRIQARKIALAEALVGIDEGGVKNITREELLSLFELDLA